MNEVRIERVRRGDAAQRRVSGGVMHVTLPQDGVVLHADGGAIYLSKDNLKVVQRVLRSGGAATVALFGDEERRKKE